MWYRILYAGLLLATTGFVWFYNQPLASDVPMHMALAKVFADYLTGVSNADATYQPYFTISSYELPELILVPLILAFGIDAAWKIALSLYGFFFPLSISYLVKKANPASRWTRLAGFPITLGYFFHWGFWPFLMGLVISVAATAASLGERQSAMPRPMEILTRLLTFLCHPIPALCVGIFDIVRLFGSVLSGSGQRALSFLRASGYLMLLWLPSAIIILFMLSNSVDEGGFKWEDVISQFAQILRPFYLTRKWYESVVPLAFAAILTYQVFFSAGTRSGQNTLLISGIVCVVIGLLMPRRQFIGSWENGARVILYGFILISATWALIEHRSKVLIMGWVISGSTINLALSHWLWSIHESSFTWAMDTLDKQFRGYRIIHRDAWTGSYGIALGYNLPTWAWCKGIAADSKNDAGMRKTGPAIYNGLSIEQRSATKTVVLYYHPYRRAPQLWEKYPNQPVYFDSGGIYSLQERVWSINTLDDMDLYDVKPKSP